jgi:hypothetical protein
MKVIESKMRSIDIELAVVALLNYRVYTIVPNVSWGMGFNHECDLLALDSKGRFTEIEIKVSASDLKADFNKKHGHQSSIISRLFYAMPIELCQKYSEIIPSNFGIIAVKKIDIYGDSRKIKNKAEFYRHAKHDKSKENPSIDQVMKFMNLGCMRIWSLKNHNQN